MKTSKYYVIFMAFLIYGVCGFTSDAVSAEVNKSRITDISVSDVDGTTEIEIKSNAPFTYTLSRPADPYKVVVDLQDMDYGSLEDSMFIDSAGVREISPEKENTAPDVARINIFLTVPADVEPIYRDNSLIIAFDNPEAGDTTIAEVLMEEEMAPESHIRQEPVIIGRQEPVTIGKTSDNNSFKTGNYIGEKISIDFQDAQLVHVFRLLADVSGYNIVVSPGVKGKFSMKLIDVPWDQALDIILRNYGLSKIVQGNIIRIAPTSVLAKEEEAIAKAKESQEKAGDLVTQVYPVNYASVSELKKAFEKAKILTKRGFAAFDERTSSVIIKDVEQKHAEYENLIRALDIPTPQVSIDAKIVEVTNNITKELGIQWGIFWEPSDSRTRIASVASLSGGGTGFNSGIPLTVNLPAATGVGKGGNIGIGYINASNLFALDLQLSALESTGKGKIISHPKITTSDNQQAKILQGKKIPYITVSENGTQTQFIDANLELIVTPHITPEGTIVMTVEVKKNEADFAGPQVAGVPTIDTKEVQTQVLIKDSDTLVIGGIFKANKAKGLEGIPGFSSIPVLGRLFQYKKNVEEVNELLVFITPRIVR
jgi:type IV pilus assembly protein PilQ